MRYNYKYGKIENGALVYAPNKLIIDTEQVFNAPDESYNAQGYLPIVNTVQPEAEEGFYYSPFYAEVDGNIVQHWEKHEIPETDEATETDYINALEDLGVSFDE